ncbi:MAG: sigma 54-interacting transcriptional regulator [Acidithiobacillus ferrooxidans]
MEVSLISKSVYPTLNELSPLSFLQAFIVQSIKVAGQFGCNQEHDRVRYIERMGLGAASCLETAARTEYSLPQDIPLSQEQYESLIVHIKNQIGGEFSSASSGASYVRVINHRCPFGEAVREAPELCRMTSSVFGAIAARNFGYAKVELRKRIAVNDGVCEILVYVDPADAVEQSGDEYLLKNGQVHSSLASTDDHIQQALVTAWCNNKITNTKRSQVNMPRIIAQSTAMRAAFHTVELVAPTTASVVISGETGTGKEIIARAIHALSDRTEKPFIAINCGAIPESLIETELFGHERGAFTNAYQIRHGVFERANGGTLFLDEINSLPISAQVKLLRVVQEGEFERVGGEEPLNVDVRIIAATNQDLDLLVKNEKFRRDLYYRLDVVHIHLPPLRERPDDKSALVDLILKRLSEKYHHPIRILSSRAWKQISAYDWPGNVREMENLLERAFLLNAGAIIDTVIERDASDSLTDSYSLRDLKRQKSDIAEYQLLHESLRRNKGRVNDVARELKVTPRAIYQKIKMLGINLKEYRLDDSRTGSRSGRPL